jgi:hypothetical protein
VRGYSVFGFFLQGFDSLRQVDLHLADDLAGFGDIGDELAEIVFGLCCSVDMVLLLGLCGSDDPARTFARFQHEQDEFSRGCAWLPDVSRKGGLQPVGGIHQPHSSTVHAGRVAGQRE